MATLAGEWWESPTLWTSLGLVVALFAAWATLHAAHPKRRLIYRVISDTPLLNPTAHLPGGQLSVVHGNRTLAEPRLVEAQLINAGRRDIVASWFHNAEPIELTLEVPIIALLEVETTSRTQRAPQAAIDAQKLTLPPCLLPKGVAITFALLVDGSEPQLSCLAPLTDVKVVEGRGRGENSVQAAIERAGTGYLVAILDMLLESSIRRRR